MTTVTRQAGATGNRWWGAQLGVFLTVVAVSLSSGRLPLPLLVKAGLGIGLMLPTGYLLLTNARLFVPALFFPIHATLSPLTLAGLERLTFEFPQLYLLPSIGVYLIIVLMNPSLRRHLQWLHHGRITPGIVVLCAVIVLGSAAALLGWALWIADDLSIFLDNVPPEVSLGVLVIYGSVFTVTNPLVEEFLARAVLFDGFAALTRRIAVVIPAQAVVFAIWHFEGFPGGVVGSSMVLIWSLLLGMLRYLSGGMLAPLVVHFFADLTIALIVLCVLILPKTT